MTLDDLTNAFFSSGKPGSQPASNGLLGLFENNSNAGQNQTLAAARALMAQGGPNFLPQQQMPQMRGVGARGPFPFFAPTINPMPIQAQIPNFAALLQSIRQSAPFLTPTQ